MGNDNRKIPPKDFKNRLSIMFKKLKDKLSIFLNILKMRFQNKVQSGKVQGKISIIEDLTKAFRHINPRKAAMGLILGVLLVYILTGVYVVNPGEQAVVKRFGRIISGSVAEGIHYSLPRPVDKVEKVNVTEVRRADVGVSLAEHKHSDDSPQTIQLLTGDENIINTEAIVHYRVKDASQYLFNVNSGDERIVRNSIESALIQVTAGMNIDDILTGEKVAAQTEIMRNAQEILDGYNSGLQITNFNIQAIVPPQEVADAFRDVTAAREDREKQINEARGYANSLIPEARGKAEEEISKATAYKSEAVNMAKGDAQKFEAMLAEYQKNSKIYSNDTTKYRLFLETMDKILPKVKKFIVNPSEDGVNLKLMDSLNQ